MEGLSKDGWKEGKWSVVLTAAPRAPGPLCNTKLGGVFQCTSHLLINTTGISPNSVASSGRVEHYYLRKTILMFDSSARGDTARAYSRELID